MFEEFIKNNINQYGLSVHAGINNPASVRDRIYHFPYVWGYNDNFFNDRKSDSDIWWYQYNIEENIYYFFDILEKTILDISEKYGKINFIKNGSVYSEILEYYCDKNKLPYFSLKINVKDYFQIEGNSSKTIDITINDLINRKEYENKSINLYTMYNLFLMDYITEGIPIFDTNRLRCMNTNYERKTDKIVDEPNWIIVDSEFNLDLDRVIKNQNINGISSIFKYNKSLIYSYLSMVKNVFFTSEKNDVGEFLKYCNKTTGLMTGSTLSLFETSGIRYTNDIKVLRNSTCATPIPNIFPEVKYIYE